MRAGPPLKVAPPQLQELSAERPGGDADPARKLGTPQALADSSVADDFTRIWHATMLQELSAERAVGDADLARKLGTLRYLKGLKASRQRALAEAEPDAAAPPPFVYTRGACVRLYVVQLDPEKGRAIPTVDEGTTLVFLCGL